MSSPPHKRERLGSLSTGTEAHAGSQHQQQQVRAGIRSTLQAGPRKSLGIAQGTALGHAPPKKLTIKNAKARSATDNADFVSNALATFTRSIRAIASVLPEPTPESFSALYSLCEACVPVTSSSSSGNSSSSSVAQTLYDRIRIELEKKVGQVKKDLMARLPTRSGPADERDDDDAAETWLQHLNEEWNAFSQQLSLIRAVFTHLDRTFVLQRKDLLSIWDLGLDIFRYKIVDDDDLGPRISSGSLTYIKKQRQANGSDNNSTTTTTTLTLSIFLNLISLLSSLSLSTYHERFVQPFLKSSESYYAQEAESLLLQNAEGTLSMGAYLRRVEQRLEEEGSRAELITSAAAPTASSSATPHHSSSSSSNHTASGKTDSGLKGRILRIVEQHLVAQQTEDILDGLSSILENLDDATRLYNLLSRVDALPELKKSLQALVQTQGYELIKDPARDETMVDTLLDFKSKTDQIFNGPFRKDQSMGFALRDGFEVFINKRQNKPAEMLAKYIDAKMRMGNKAMADDELENTFDRVLYLFNFTQAKDLFEAFYTRMFAKRLLLNKSASSDMEKIMLLKLQRACGAAFTSKLETMAKDMDLSTDLMAAYREHRSSLDASDPFELSVNVLTTGNWPSFTPSQPILPQDMVAALDRFKRFYSIKYTGRNLSWQHSLDQCTLKASFPKGKKELSVSLFQALVMMLFNQMPSGESLSYRSIVEQTNLDAKEVARTLQSLACGRVRVLTKTPKGKDVNEGDTFTVNEDFSDPKLRIKINQIQIKETVEEQKSTTDRVFVDRQNHVQLVIVRTLKSRKTMKHTELVMEVVDQLKSRFKVETTEIKKAISSLIDRDYMERSDQGKDVYNYVA